MRLKRSRPKLLCLGSLKGRAFRRAVTTLIAAFVHHGALPAALVYDTCQEMYFQYAKIQPHLAGFRRAMNLPEWMSSLQRLVEVEGSKPGRKRLAVMRKNLEAMAKARSSQT